MSHPRLHLRLYLAPGVWLGPGKAELMAQIAATGSISAAGRAMGMSYKRAWTLVEALNAIYTQPLVDAARGGASGGGAALSDKGAQVLAAYRALEVQARQAGAGAIATLAQDLAPDPPGKAPSAQGDLSGGK